MTHQPAVILVVEDDLHIGRLIAMLLEDAGYQVQRVGTAAEALTELDRGGFDLVVLDWMLPDLAGDEVCRLIKAHQSDGFLPVLMLTARGELADRVAGLNAGADDYLTKPFHTDEFLARVSALLRIRKAEQGRLAALAELERQHGALQETYHQLNAAQEQLVRTSKLAALGELVAGVAHELNNPLAIILGNAELLPELADEEDRRAIEQIIAGAQRARRVVQSLITFARHGRIEEDWHNPRELVEQVLDINRAVLRSHGVSLDLACAERLPSLWVDGTQIQQVLINLLLNAVQALSGRPEPHIAIRVFTADHQVGAPPLLPETAAIDGCDGAEHVVVIDIADNGPGLAEEIADRIFQPFVTTKPVGQGTGLGLAIAYGIITQHGGNLMVASQLDRGVTFRIILPIDRDDSGLSVPLLADPLLNSTGRVLVIDDEPGLLDIVRHLLGRHGYDVTALGEARRALQMLRQQSYDVILCDLKMPDINGMAFYERLQDIQLPNRPRLVIMTGDTSSSQTEEFLRRTKLPVLRKPFTSHELLAVVSSGHN